MDTALTIVTGACAERWKFLTFAVSSVLMGAFTYPLFANWAWGGGWLAQLGTNLGLGKGYSDFAGSGVVHAVGGLTALAVALIVGPRIGKFNRDGSSNVILGHASCLFGVAMCIAGDPNDHRDGRGATSRIRRPRTGSRTLAAMNHGIRGRPRWQRRRV